MESRAPAVLQRPFTVVLRYPVHATEIYQAGSPDWEVLPHDVLPDELRGLRGDTTGGDVPRDGAARLLCRARGGAATAAARGAVSRAGRGCSADVYRGDRARSGTGPEVCGAVLVVERYVILAPTRAPVAQRIERLASNQ